MAEESPASLATRIDAVEARFAVADVVHAYARYIRSDQPDRVAEELFTPDSFYEMRDGDPDKAEYTVRRRLEGRAEVDGFLSKMKGNPHPVPLIHNLVITVDGDTATGNSVLEGQVYGGDHKTLGEYHDTFRRIDGRWYFSSRIFTIFQKGSSH